MTSGLNLRTGPGFKMYQHAKYIGQRLFSSSGQRILSKGSITVLSPLAAANGLVRP